MIIGITGNIGSGKSTFSKFLYNFLKKNYKVNLISADKIGHRVIEKDDIKEKLINRWGTSILKGNFIDRVKVRKLIFSNKEEYNFLCLLVWPEILREIKELIKPFSINLIEAAILVEAKWHKICDLVILVDAPFSKRFLRKPFLSLKEFLLINSYQFPSSVLEVYSNYIVKNNSSLKNLKSQAKLISDLISFRIFKKFNKNKSFYCF